MPGHLPDSAGSFRRCSTYQGLCTCHVLNVMIEAGAYKHLRDVSEAMEGNRNRE